MLLEQLNKGFAESKVEPGALMDPIQLLFT